MKQSGKNFEKGTIESKSPYEYFEEFYNLQNNKPMSDVQKDFIKNLISQIWGEEK